MGPSSVYIACGATAGVMSGSPLNAAIKASARLSPSAGVFASATGNWMMVCPSTPRRPAAFVSFAISSSK